MKYKTRNVDEGMVGIRGSSFLVPGFTVYCLLSLLPAYIHFFFSYFFLALLCCPLSFQNPRNLKKLIGKHFASQSRHGNISTPLG